MADLNSISLTGRLGRDPELRTTKDGKSVCTARVAVAGFKEGDTTWVTLVAWERTGEVLSDYCKKGDRVGVTGSLQLREYEAKDGTQKVSVEVRVMNLSLLSDKRDREQGEPQQRRQETHQRQQAAPWREPQRQTEAQFDRDLDDDLPF